MLGKKIEKTLNEQINAEMYSSYLYLSMSAYFDSKNLGGFSHWMKIQAQEELVHAMKIFNYVNERGGRVELTAIEAPNTEWDSPLAVFKNAYEHELKVTALINNLVDLSISEKDHATTQFLQWYVEEQVEEEASADEIVQKITLAKDAPGAMYMIDKELTQRLEAFSLDAAIAAAK